MTLLAKRFPTLVGVLVLLTGVVFGIWFVNSKKINTASDTKPNNVRITNVADNKFVVSWVTDVETQGKVMYGKVGEKLSQVALDERDQLNNEAASYLTHYVVVKDLQPNTTYAFRIVSGPKGTLYDNNGSPYSVTTGPTIAQTPPAETIYGRVEHASTLPAEGAIVYLSFPGAAPASTLVKSSGSYTIPVSTLRTTDLKSYIKYDPQATIFNITVEQGKQQATADVVTANAAPVPLITMGASHDYKSPQKTIEPQDPVVAQVEPIGPSPTPLNTTTKTTTSSFDTQPLGPSSGNTSVVTITNPSEEGEVLASALPELAGEGPKGTVLSLVLQSAKRVYKDTVAIGQNGRWSWVPTSELANDNYTLSLAYLGGDGKEKTIKRTFRVNTSLTTQPAFVATPSASLKPSPKPSLTPTPSPSVRAAMPATESGVPVTGVIENTVLTVVVAAVIMIGGVLFLAL